MKKDQRSKFCSELLKYKILILIPLIFMVTVTVSINDHAAAANSVIYVNGTGGSDSNPGTSWNQAKLTIKNATGTVSGGGTVKIADGTYKGMNNRGITLNRSMTITGMSEKGTVINAEKKDRVFTIIPGVTVKIMKLSILNGYVTGNGGAIANKGTLTVTQTTFKQNIAHYSGIGSNNGNGGAISSTGKLTVDNSLFTGNQARIGVGAAKNNTNNAGGGAILNDHGSTTITGSTFKNNLADVNGGAIVNSFGTLTVTSSTFQSNMAHGGGGAITNGNGTTTVKKSKFSGNTATGNNGGAIVNGGGKITVAISTFLSNAAKGGGGAILNGFATLIITGSKFLKNTAKGDNGGAMLNGGGNITVNHSTFESNTAHIGGGAILNGGGNLKLTNSMLKSNLAHQNGGAILVAGGTLQVYNSNITSNKVTGMGGAIYVEYSAKKVTKEGVSDPPISRGTFVINGSNLTYNTAKSGGAIYNKGGTGKVHFNRIIKNEKKDIVSPVGKVDARYNWWGSNANPSHRVSGNVLVKPWLILSITAHPTTLAAGSSTTVTVDLLHDSNGTYHDPNLGHVPDWIRVTFYPTNGAVDPITAYLMNGRAQTTYTIFTGGKGTVSARVDSQVVEVVLNGKKNNNNLYTVPMQDTGAPLIPLVTAMVTVSGGILLSRRK